jgi:5-formyltetrahydrofolate cyclo-ligase
MDDRLAFVRSLDDAARTKLEARLATALAPLCAHAEVIAAYFPLGSEISPLRALEAAAARGATIAFPAFDHPAEPFRFRAGAPVGSGPWGINQPLASDPEVVPDLVLVPLVAIDAIGTRLGRGRGHYDRVLGPLRKRAMRLIGIGWTVQRLRDRIPAESFDVPLDAFASPDGVEEFNRRN